MRPPNPPVPAGTTPTFSGETTPAGMTSGQRRSAERAETNALMARLRVLQPDFRCFAGSIVDLRDTVARLEHHAHRDRHAHREGQRAGEDVYPRVATRLAASRAARAGDAAAERGDARAAQLTRWHHGDTAARSGDQQGAGSDQGRGSG